jgi:hypothetical protein
MPDDQRLTVEERLARLEQDQSAKGKKPDQIARVISAIGLTVAIAGVAFSCSTYRANFAERARLSGTVGQQIYVTRKPFVGVLLTAYNSGAQPGVIVRGTLKWDGHSMKLVMTTTDFGSWSYADGASAKEMRFSFFAPVVVPKHSSTPLVVWFSRDAPERFFGAGDRHQVEIALFDDVNSQPVLTKTFTVRLSADDISNIYPSENVMPMVPIYIDSPEERSPP